MHDMNICNLCKQTYVDSQAEKNTNRSKNGNINTDLHLSSLILAFRPMFLAFVQVLFG